MKSSEFSDNYIMIVHCAYKMLWSKDIAVFDAAFTIDHLKDGFLQGTVYSVSIIFAVIRICANQSTMMLADSPKWIHAAS